MQRLKEYKSKLIVFPRKASKPKQGDSEVSQVTLFLFLRGWDNKKFVQTMMTLLCGTLQNISIKEQ